MATHFFFFPLFYFLFFLLFRSGVGIVTERRFLSFLALVLFIFDRFLFDSAAFFFCSCSCFSFASSSSFFFVRSFVLSIFVPAAFSAKQTDVVVGVGVVGVVVAVAGGAEAK